MTTPSAPEPKTRGQVAASLARRMNPDQAGGFPPGDLSALRRGMDAHPSTFWRLLAHVENDLGKDLRPEQARRWGVVLQALAIHGALHKPGQAFGVALSEAGFSPSRLERLLRADGEALDHLVVQTARFLAAKGQHADLVPLVYLVLEDDLVKTRRDIAQDFFRNEHKKSTPN